MKKKQLTDLEIKDSVLAKLQNYLEDNAYDSELLKAFEWLENYILDLETEIEINKNLAEEERTQTLT